MVHEIRSWTTEPADWCSTPDDFAMHQTRRMLFMAQDHVAANPFHAECLKLIQKLRNAPNQTLPHSVLLKGMKTDSLSFLRMVETLVTQGDIMPITQMTSGRTSRAYKLVDATAEEGGERSG